MIYSTATVPVNPAGQPPLTREQAWAGLVLKARDARLFLPPGLCSRCDVVEESDTHIVREATIGGADLREIIAFEPGHKVSFFQAGGPREGVIVNELFEDGEGSLQLRFYCYLGLRGKAPGGAEEQAEQAMMDSDQGYRAALSSTLARPGASRAVAAGRVSRRPSPRCALIGRHFPVSSRSCTQANSVRLALRSDHIGRKRHGC